MSQKDYAVVIPLANESKLFDQLVELLYGVLDQTPEGTIYFVVDKATKDNTLELCQAVSTRDTRFITIWAPENKNVVDAYLRGYQEAYQNGHQIIIEMDGGLSHDPRSIPQFVEALRNGYECVFGSRFLEGGSIDGGNPKRLFLSRGGTMLSNLLLGTCFNDMTSGYQGYHAAIVKNILEYTLLSKAHFYQTELRYLLRHRNYLELPIHYQNPSPSVSNFAIRNALYGLFSYFWQRITFRTKRL